MNTDTTIALIKAYVSLAETHRKAAMEHGPYHSARALHFVKAEEAEIAAIAWTRRAESAQAAQGLEVRHG
jgi:hypothetical protein